MTARFMGALGLGLLCAALAPLACSSFSGDSDTPGADAGDGSAPSSEGGGVTGSADYGLSVQVGDPAAVNYVVQGDKVSIPIKLTRHPSTTDAVTVTISGTLPDKVSIAPLTIPANATDGTLVLMADADAAQTKFKVQVLASSSTGSGIADLNGFVRGKPGALDTTFGTNGVVRNIFGTTKNASALDIVLLSDGRVGAVGFNGTFGAIGTSWVAMFSADGVFDNTYGTGGYGALAMSCALGQAAIDSSDRILVVSNGSANSTLLGRFTAKGEPDSDFGNGGGVVPITVGVEQIGGAKGPIESSPLALAVRSDGTSIVSFQAAVQMGPNLGLGAYDVHGSPILGFGTNGVVVGPKIFTGGTPISGIRSTGNIWTLWTDSSTSHTSERTGDTGADASGFGDLGSDTTPAGNWTVHGAATLPDTSLVYAVSTGSSVAVSKFVKDGSHLDVAYGNRGVVSIDAAATAVVATDASSRVLVGLSADGAGIRVARLAVTGDYDTTFGDSGTVTHNFGTNQKLVNLVQQKDGRIVVIGQEDVTGGTDGTLSRYWP